MRVLINQEVANQDMANEVSRHKAPKIPALVGVCPSGPQKTTSV